MKPVKGLYKHNPENFVYGDCFRACIASILEIDIKALWHSHDELRTIDADCHNRYINRSLKLYGYYVFGVPFISPDATDSQILEMFGISDDLKDMYCILCGMGKTAAHCVVMRGGKVVHDPSYETYHGLSPIDGHYWVYFIAPLKVIGERDDKV